MNLDLKFDDDFKNGLLQLIDEYGRSYIDLTGETEAEILEKLQESHETNDEEKVAALSFIAALFFQGIEELNTAFQGEMSAEVHEYSDDKWIIAAYSTAIAANEFHRQSIFSKFVKAVDDFKDKNSKIYLDIQKEVDSRIKEFLKQAVAEGREVTEGKMAFWASDQTGNLVRDTAKGLFKTNNAEYYIWMTQEDGRVRPEHAALYGTLRKWGEGLEPGEAWACRCYPVVATQTQILKFKKTGNNKVIVAA